jgi:hypothetical protein
VSTPQKPKLGIWERPYSGGTRQIVSQAPKKPACSEKWARVRTLYGGGAGGVLRVVSSGAGLTAVPGRRGGREAMAGREGAARDDAGAAGVGAARCVVERRLSFGGRERIWFRLCNDSGDERASQALQAGAARR